MINFYKSSKCKHWITKVHCKPKLYSQFPWALWIAISLSSKSIMHFHASMLKHKWFYHKIRIRLIRWKIVTKSSWQKLSYTSTRSFANWRAVNGTQVSFHILRVVLLCILLSMSWPLGSSTKTLLNTSQSSVEIRAS